MVACSVAHHPISRQGASRAKPSVLNELHSLSCTGDAKYHEDRNRLLSEYRAGASVHRRRYDRCNAISVARRAVRRSPLQRLLRPPPSYELP